MGGQNDEFKRKERRQKERQRGRKSCRVKWTVMCDLAGKDMK